MFPDHAWTKDVNSKQFVENVAKELKIKEFSDWYNVTKEDILRFSGGESVIKSYKGSLFRLFSTIFPEYPWLPWRFSKTYLNDPDRLDYVLDFVAKQLKITDWTQVTTKV